MEPKTAKRVLLRPGKKENFYPCSGEQGCPSVHDGVPPASPPASTRSVTALALVVVLVAAGLHATWNLCAKRAGGGLPFVWLVLTAMSFTPVSYVAPTREGSIVIGACFGARDVLRRNRARARLRVAPRSARRASPPMKSRIFFAVILIAAFAAFYFGTIRPAMTPLPLQSRPPIATRPTPSIPPSVIDHFEKMVLPPLRIPAPAIVSVHLEQLVLKMEIPITNEGVIDLPLNLPGEKPSSPVPEIPNHLLK